MDEYGFHQFHDDPKLKGKSVTEWGRGRTAEVDVGTRGTTCSDTRSDTPTVVLFPNCVIGATSGRIREQFSSEDTDRTLDSAERLLKAVSASQAGEVNRMKMELRRLVMDEQARGKKRKAAGSLIESPSVQVALKPWREIAMPHNDVATGGYQQAEFAADLWQVHLGEGSDEYRDPQEFFRRTYLTDSLRRLLEGAAKRLTGKGGDPVVQLQTNFGGGKTHSMLGLYHLFSGMAPGKLEGNGRGAGGRGGRQAPIRTARRAGWEQDFTWEIRLKSRTVRWYGRCGANWRTSLAGGTHSSGSARMTNRATNPGDTLRELLIEYGPCVVLIDEWVSYARQLHDEGDLPGRHF